MMQDITERIWCDCTDKHCDYREAVEEIKRLRAGGCARDQSTTQYCAEAARLAVENERLRAALENIAKQKLAAEMDENVMDVDWFAGYEGCVNEARAALKEDRT